MARVMKIMALRSSEGRNGFCETATKLLWSCIHNLAEDHTTRAFPCRLARFAAEQLGSVRALRSPVWGLAPEVPKSTTGPVSKQPTEGCRSEKQRSCGPAVEWQQKNLMASHTGRQENKTDEWGKSAVSRQRKIRCSRTLSCLLCIAALCAVFHSTAGVTTRSTKKGDIANSSARPPGNKMQPK